MSSASRRSRGRSGGFGVGLLARSTRGLASAPSAALRSALRVMLVAAALVSTGCAPVARVDEEAVRRSAPQTLAVLPFVCAVEDRGARANLQVAALTEATRRRLSTTTWLVAEPSEVDASLVRAGLVPADVARGLLDEESPQADALEVLLARRARDLDLTTLPAPGLSAGATAAHICHALGVDAVLVGRISVLSNIEGGVVFAQTIEGEVQLLDADGGSLALVPHTERVIGGLLPESTQSLRAIRDTMTNSSDEGFVRLADRWAEGLVRQLPEPPAPAALVPPRIEGATLVTTGGRGLAPATPLVAGDRVEVEVQAAPGLVATADLTDGARGVPLAEESPGRYRGAWQVQPGERASERPSVLVVDRFGAGCERGLHETPLALAAARPVAPVVRRVTTVAGGTRVAWAALPGVVRYGVYAIGPRGTPRLLACVPVLAVASAEVSVVVPTPGVGERLAVAAVIGHGGHAEQGALAIAPAIGPDATATAHERGAR